MRKYFLLRLCVSTPMIQQSLLTNLSAFLLLLWSASKTLSVLIHLLRLQVSITFVESNHIDSHWSQIQLSWHQKPLSPLVSGQLLPQKNYPTVRVGVWVKGRVSFRIRGQPDDCPRGRFTPMVRVGVWFRISFGVGGDTFRGCNRPRIVSTNWPSNPVCLIGILMERWAALAMSKSYNNGLIYENLSFFCWVISTTTLYTPSSQKPVNGFESVAKKLPGKYLTPHKCQCINSLTGCRSYGRKPVCIFYNELFYISLFLGFCIL